MSKAKGSRTERELIALFWKQGWGCTRVAGSGSTPLPSPDILVGKPGRVLAIECKSGKTVRYVEKDQIDELNEFSKRFGADALIGVRFDRKGWYFLRSEQMKITNRGAYAVSLKLAQEVGLTFEELIK
jgi:Holliday junction resolvase